MKGGSKSIEILSLLLQFYQLMGIITYWLLRFIIPYA